MFHREADNGAAVLMSFLVGGIVGAGLALLFAPSSGKKMRGRIADMAEDVRDYTADYAKKLKDKVS